MKRTILTLAVFALMAGTISTSYGQNPDRRSVNARENVQESRNNRFGAKQDLKEAQRRSVLEYRNFKNEADIKIRNNERRIAGLKVKLSKIHSREKSNYQRDLRVLEQKNVRLKRKLANYKDKGQEKWGSFKREFNHDLDELGQALRDFDVNSRR